MQYSLKRNYGISILRLLSTMLIVACHICQAYENSLAFYLNIGVPIFFSISGYLYGKRKKESPLNFLYNRFVKVIIPYYGICIIVFLVNLMFSQFATIKQVISMVFIQQAFGETLINCGHLWFVSIIAICYLITPLLWEIRDNLRIKVQVGILLLFLLLVISVIYVNSLPFNCIYITAYIFGFVVSYILPRTKLVIVGNRILTIIGIVVYMVMFVIENKAFPIPGIFMYMIKVFISIMLLFFVSEFDVSPSSSMIKITVFCDAYSFPVYLCHHIWILGALSLIGFTGYVVVDVLFAVLATILSSLLFGYIFNRFTNKLIKK